MCVPFLCRRGFSRHCFGNTDSVCFSFRLTCLSHRVKIWQITWSVVEEIPWSSWCRDSLSEGADWETACLEKTPGSQESVRERQKINKIDGPCLCVDWLCDRWVVFIRMVMVLPLSLLFSSLPDLRSFSINCPRFWPGWFTLGGIWHFGGDTHLSRYPTLSSLSTIHNIEHY